MNENELNTITENDLQKIRERAYRQRAAFRRMHGGAAPHPKEVNSRQNYSYQPGYSDKVSVSVPEKREAGSSLAIISLILGIVSILFFWAMIFVIPLALIGILTAVKVIRSKKDKGIGTAALCTSVIGLVLALIMTVFVVTNSDRILKALDEIEDSITAEYGDDFNDTPGNPFRGPKNMSFPGEAALSDDSALSDSITYSDNETAQTVCI